MFALKQKGGDQFSTRCRWSTSKDNLILAMSDSVAFFPLFSVVFKELNKKLRIFVATFLATRIHIHTRSEPIGFSSHSSEQNFHMHRMSNMCYETRPEFKHKHIKCFSVVLSHFFSFLFTSLPFYLSLALSSILFFTPLCAAAFVKAFSCEYVV